jgi:DNA polymerase III delta subunit
LTLAPFHTPEEPLTTARFIKTKTIEPYYIIYGDNDLFKEDFVKELLEVLLVGKVDSSAVHVLDASDKETGVTAAMIKEKAGTMSFFSERNFIVVKEFTKLQKEEFEELMEYLPSLPGACNMVLTSSMENKDFDKKVLAHYKNIPAQAIFNFSSGRTADIKKWGRDYLAKAGKSIDEEVLDYIIDESNSDAASMKNELDKMILISGDRQEIGRNDFNSVRGVDKEYDMWALTGAFAAKDEKRVFLILDKIFDDMGPEAIMGALFAEIKKIYIVRYFTGKGEDRKALKYTYFSQKRLDEARQSVKNFKTAPYVDILNIVKDADRAVKLSNRQMAKTIIIMMLQKIFLRLEGKQE